VVCEYVELEAFDEVAEVFDGKVNCQSSRSKVLYQVSAERSFLEKRKLGTILLLSAVAKQLQQHSLRHLS